MSGPLLATKLYLPSSPTDLVPRPQLIKKLNNALQRKAGLILISAPAGFGKTTLISEWLNLFARDKENGISGKKVAGQTFSPPSPLLSPPPKFAWLSLDEGDNDPIRFLNYFIAALQQIHPDIGQTAQEMLLAGHFQIQAADTDPHSETKRLEVIITTVINDIAALLVESQCVVILDDYHTIEAETIHHALTFLLDHMPTQLHLVVVTRSHPPLPLARLRVRRQLIELQAADLRFSPDEVAAFLNQVMGLNLSTEEVAALERRTEGWIAGLQLAALSLQGHQDTAGFMAAFTGSHRYVLDYLVEEVLQQQPEHVQRFLLQTAILNRLCGSLCDAVLSREAQAQEGLGAELFPLAPPLPRPAASGQAMLEYLTRTNLFIIPLDDIRHWYRYHQLFVDSLRDRLYQIASVPSHPLLAGLQGGISGLHRRAAAWYEGNGLAAEAIGHWLAAQDLEQAARLIEQTARKMWMNGELVTLLGWLKALPDKLIRARPKLGLFYTWALLPTRQLETVEAILQDAEPEITQNELLGETAAVRATVARMRGDPAQAIELSEQALEKLSDANVRLRSVIALNLGHGYRQRGDIEAAGQAFAEARALSQTTGNLYTMLFAISNLAELQKIQGHLHQADNIYRQALHLAAERNGLQLPVMSVVHIGLGEVLREWNALKAAESSLAEGITLAKQGDLVKMLLDAYVALARLKQAQRDESAAINNLQKAERLARSKIPPGIDRIVAWQARLRLAQGDLKAAADWAQASGIDPDDAIDLRRETEYLTLVRVLTAQGAFEPALRLLQKLLNAAETARRIGCVIELLILQALALKGQSESSDKGRGYPQAIANLSKALSLAEPEGYVRLFVDEGPAMASLLAQLAPTPYCNKLLAAFDNDTQRESRIESQKIVPSAPPSTFPTPLVEPLSKRELEVLRRVATGASNKEIAREMMVTIHTIKKHVSNILAKLGVKSRTQAVARGRELGLL